MSGSPDLVAALYPETATFHGMRESDVIERIESGALLAEIAAEVGVNRSMLTRWLSADEQRSVRARDARMASAAAHEERAEQRIEKAADPFELAKAKELAHHLRWRASKIAPKEYGERMDVNHSGTIDLATRLAAARERTKDEA